MICVTERLLPPFLLRNVTTPLQMLSKLKMLEGWTLVLLYKSNVSLSQIPVCVLVENSTHVFVPPRNASEIEREEKITQC